MLDWLYSHPRLTALILGPITLVVGLAAIIAMVITLQWFVNTTWGLTVVVCSVPLLAAYCVGRIIIVDIVNEMWEKKQQMIWRKEKGLIK